MHSHLFFCPPPPFVSCMWLDFAVGSLDWTSPLYITVKPKHHQTTHIAGLLGPSHGIIIVPSQTPQLLSTASGIYHFVDRLPVDTATYQRRQQSFSFCCIAAKHGWRPRTADETRNFRPGITEALILSSFLDAARWTAAAWWLPQPPRSLSNYRHIHTAIATSIIRARRIAGTSPSSMFYVVVVAAWCFFFKWPNSTTNCHHRTPRRLTDLLTCLCHWLFAEISCWTAPGSWSPATVHATRHRHLLCSLAAQVSWYRGNMKTCQTRTTNYCTVENTMYGPVGLLRPMDTRYWAMRSRKDHSLLVQKLYCNICTILRSYSTVLRNRFHWALPYCPELWTFQCVQYGIVIVFEFKLYTYCWRFLQYSCTVLESSFLHRYSPYYVVATLLVLSV